MKKSILIAIAFIFIFQSSGYTQEASDSTGMLGDNFSLEGALQLFKESQTLEEFEKKLNDQDTYVNNLDLNQDGKTDYIKVIDNMDDEAHAIVLQTDLNDKESQDIAVIEMEKTAANTVAIQIVGDEDLYGENTYVEPVPESVTNQSGSNVTVVNTAVVNVWGWPSVRYIYGPRYHIWVSPWRWGYYPGYWRPWRPHPWRYYHNRRVRYHVYFHPVRIHRIHHAHKIYAPRRRTSVTVHTRSTSIRVNRNNHLKIKSKTTTTGIKKQNGKIVASKKTTTTKKVKGKHGTTKTKTTKKTTVKKNKNKTTVKRKKTTTKTRKRKRR